MADGDLVVSDYQAEIRTTLMGAGTNYELVEIDVPTPPIIRNDVPKLLGHGMFQGSHFKGSLVVTLGFIVKGTTTTTLRSNLDTLETAWAYSATDINFVLRLPSWGKRRITGRPINFDPGTWTPQVTASRRLVGVRAQFEAGDPTWTQL